MSPTIDNHTVTGDDDGCRYLNSLEYNEAKVIFEHAKRHGMADFEDHRTRRNYTLHYHNGAYTVNDRETKKSGWF